VSYLGRSIFTSFGLEGVNNGVGATTHEELLSHFFAWAMDEPTVVITHTAGVEVTTNRENKAIDAQQVTVTACQSTPEFRYFMPLILKGEAE
jgi:hypothetical protein